MSPGDSQSVGDGLRLATAQGRWVLLATVLGSAIASIDATVVGIALPAIGRDFHVGLTLLQWVVTAYTLVLAGLLLLAGALGDKYGRKKVFEIGVAWFAAASIICGSAPNPGVLIAARALQGVGAALLTPGSLAILEATFCPDDRGRAIGAWSGLSGVGIAIGPFLGGWLVQAVSWRLIFVINLPIAAVVLAVSRRHVPETKNSDQTGKLDVLGGVLITLGLVGFTYGLIEGPDSGWGSAPVLIALLAGLALLAAFIVRERRATNPMLPLSLFSSAQFTATNVVTFVVYGAIGGALFLLPIQLQQVSGYTALEAGISLLPVTVITLLLSSRSGDLASRIGPRLQMSVGPLLVGAGLALFTLIGPGGNYLTEVLPGVVVFGLGLAVTVAPLTATALAAAPAERAGTASAVNNDVARGASLIAVAVLPAAGGITGDAYLHPDLFSAGFHRASLIAAALCLLGGLLAAATIRNPRAAAAAGPARLPAPSPDGTEPTRAYRNCALDAPPATAADCTVRRGEISSGTEIS
jgi:EmrB/QacA subfamily drug resistance transporter